MSRKWKPLPTNLPGWKRTLVLGPSRRMRKRMAKRFRHSQSRPRWRKDGPIPERAEAPSKAKKPEDIYRVLHVFHPDRLSPVQSVWRRKAGVWRCVEAQPPLDWFLGIIHPDVAGNYLRQHHLTFQWLKAIPVCAAPDTHTEEHPAEAHTPHAASVPQGNNTVPSQNNDTPLRRSDRGLEQDGVSTSSLLNCQARA